MPQPKIATSGSVIFEAQFKTILFHGSHAPNHLINFESCNVRMSINTAEKYSFEYILLIVHHLVTKLGQLVNEVTSNVLRKNTAWFGGLCPKSRPFLIYQPAAIYEKCIWWARDFLLFPRYALRRSKIAKIIY